MAEPVNLWSATTLINLALGTSKPLVEWNVRMTAEAAYDKLNTLRAFHEDNDRDGAIKWLKDARWVKTGAAAARGTDVHTAAEALALGTTPEPEEHIAPYVTQYRRFLEAFQPEFLLAEAPVYNLTHGYAGTLDGVLRMQGQTVVADIKTTAHGPTSGKARPPFPEVALQLTLYRNAELVGLLADRREVNYRRYYAYDPASHTEPMPATDGAVCIVVSPEDYLVVPVDTGPRVWRYCRHMIEMARWQAVDSKTVLGPVVQPEVPA
jgi:hypothetical protein